MNMDIVRQLLDGSSNIDRMIKETDQLVRMIRGMVEGYVPVKGTTVSFHSDFCRWDIKLMVGTSSDDIVCWVRHKNRNALGYRLGGRSLCLNVQYVYESLPAFVEGMIKTFPEIRRSLEPFIRASEIKFI